MNAEIVSLIQLSEQKSFNMKIAKKKVGMQSPLVNPIIDLERPLEKVLKKGHIAIKCHNTPGDRFYDINLPYYGGGSPKEWLV